MRSRAMPGAMPLKTKLAVALALLVAAAVVAIAFIWPSSTVSDESDFTAVAVADHSKARSPGSIDERSPLLVVDRIAMAPEEAAPGSRRERLGARRVASLNGRVIDSRGRIVVGAAIEGVRPVGDELQLLPFGVEAPAAGEPIRARSGRDGTFHFDDLVRGTTFDLFASGRTGQRGVVRGVCVGFMDEVVIELQPVTTITGVVVDARDERPVAGAIVRMRNGTTDGSHALVTTADGEGRFTFSGVLGTGVMALAAAPDGRTSGPYTPSFSPGDEVELELAVGLAGAGAGKVVDAESGEPIPGATIALAEFSDVVAAHGDETGRFEIRPPYSPSRGVVDVIIRAHGFSCSGGKLRVAEDAGDPPPSTVFKMKRMVVAIGRVAWRDGSPLIGATMVAVRADGSRQIPRGLGTTQTDGSFRIEGIDRGTRHVLLVRHDECEWLTTPFPDDDAARTEVDFGTLRVGRGAIVAGTVTDDRGTPMARAYVNLKTNGGDSRGVECDTQGRFEFQGVPAGHATLQAWVDGFKEPAQLELDVEDEAIIESVALPISSGLSISGRVSDVTGAPSAGAVIVLHRSGESDEKGHDVVATTHADADGRFRCVGLAAGTYRLDVRVEKSEAMRSASTRVERVDAGTSDLQVVLPDASFVTGRVVDGTGKPLPGASLRLLDPDGTLVATGNSDREGDFRIAVPPGREFRIEARVFDPRHPTSVQAGPVAAAQDHVHADGTPVTLFVEVH